MWVIKLRPSKNDLIRSEIKMQNKTCLPNEFCDREIKVRKKCYKVNDQIKFQKFQNFK